MGCLFGFRWWVAIAGLVMVVIGWEETRVAWRCRSTPETVTLEELEKGYRPPNDYLSIGTHLALLEGGVYEEVVPKGQKPSNGQNPKAELNYFYYPIVSLQNPVAQGADFAHGSYSVLVKSHEFKTMGQLGAKIGDGTPLRSEGVSGVVINVVDPLDKEEQKLLHEAFPAVNLDNVLLLELDRTPKSRGSALGLLLIGALVMVSPLGLSLAKRFAGADRAPGALSPLPLSSAAPTTPSRPAPAPAAGATWGAPSSVPPSGHPAPPGTSTALGYAPPSSYPPLGQAPPSSYGPTGTYSSQPPPPASISQRPPASVPPISARLQPGARVRVTRKSGDVFGSVVKVQAGQVSVNLDDGRTVWVATDVISLA